MSLNFFKIIFVFLTAVGNIIIGLFVFRRDPKQRINKLFCFISLSYAAWTLSLFFYEFPLIGSSLLWIKSTYFIASITEVMILAFSFIFPIPVFRRVWKLAALYGLFFLVASKF